jgi:CheY-like chemotaxis protein
VTNAPHVLVVDKNSDTADVLRAVFEPRGGRVDRRHSAALIAGESGSGIDVLVLDSDALSPTDSLVSGRWSTIPRIIIGSHESGAGNGPVAGPHFTQLNKPFEYAVLVECVERAAKNAVRR